MTGGTDADDDARSGGIAADDPGIEDDGREIIVEKRHKRVQRWRIARAVRRVVRDARAGAPEQAAFEARLRGTLPAAGPTVLAACDPLYFERFAEPFLRSLEAAGGTAGIHLHVVAEDDAIARELEGWRADSPRLSWTMEADSDAVDALAFRTVYHTAARFLVAPTVRSGTGAPVLCLDIDSLARRDVWAPIEAGLGSRDLLIAERPERKQATRRTLAGTVAFGATERGGLFCERLGRALRLGLGLDPLYHLDQIMLTYLIERMRRGEGLEVAPVPEAFLTFDEGAVAALWSAKGWDTKDSDAFRAAQDATLEQDATSDGGEGARDAAREGRG